MSQRQVGRYALPTEKAVFPPKEGWKRGGVYLVRVSYRTTNPIHEAILQVGLLNEDGTPGPHSFVSSTGYERTDFCHPSETFYLEVVGEALAVIGD